MGAFVIFGARIEYGDIEEVAWWADYPTIHHDLTSRHTWLRKWFDENSHRLVDDPDFFDPKVAGWWVWGISLWIGGSWCANTSDCIPRISSHHGGSGISAQRVGLQDQIPHVSSSSGGSGVSAQRVSMPGERVSDKIPQVSSSIGGSGVSAQRVELRDKRPHVASGSGGQGVSAQRVNMPGQANDQRPHVEHKGGGVGVSAQRINMPGQANDSHVANTPGGRGISAQRVKLQDQVPQADGRGISAQRVKLQDQVPQANGQGVSVQRHVRPQLLDWFRELQERLKAVIVLNRSWESAVTPTLLMHTPTSQKPSVGILMDPPYKTEERSNNLYASDLSGESNAIAIASYKWAVENGDIYRIAYCAHEGDFEVPEGWQVEISNLTGIKKAERQRSEMVIFSPKCVAERQLTLL